MTGMEDLNKNQLVLLTLLVSFVTSIATGIITTSLLAEAPVSVTQTINRVVERTIETVVPADPSSKKNSLSPEDQALLAAVNRAVSVAVEIRETGSATSTPGILGIIVSNDGTIVATNKNITATSTYFAILPSEAVVDLDLVSAEVGSKTAVFKIKEADTPPAEGTTSGSE